MTASGGDPGQTPPEGGWEAPPIEQFPPAYAEHPVAPPPPYPPPGYASGPYAYPGGPAYPGYPPQYVTVPAGNNRMAIASVVFSVLWLCGLGSVIGILLGAIALNQVKRSGQAGYGLAVAGIAIGAAGIVVALISMTFSSTWG